jgi:hypothetical protein
MTTKVKENTINFKEKIEQYAQEILYDRIPGITIVYF